MTKEESIKKAWMLAKTGKQHRDYEKVVKLADDLLAYITGEGIDRLLFQFVMREDEIMFKQRVALTSPTTAAMASSIMKPFYKVSRNDKVKKRIDFGNPEKNQQIEQMLAGFFGAKRKKNKGLIHWLRTRFVELTFQDPNAWVVTQWGSPSPDEVPEPHPFEISSREAKYFELVNEELRCLFADIVNFTKEVLQDNEEIKEEPARKFMYYDPDWTVVLSEVDNKLLLKTRELVEGEELVEWNNKWFLQTVYEPKVGFIAAFRVGYERDGATAGRTCVSPMHPALCFFKKSLKTVSELDLSMTLHTFPQKIQYVQKCMGESSIKSCHNGYVNGTADKCSNCGGKGYKIHTTAQDAILLPMPEDKEDMIDLNQILVYKNPPIDLIKFMDEYTKGLKQEAHLAVFNSQIFVNPDIQFAKTATEVDANMQGVYDTLEPYVEKISEVHREEVYLFAHLAAVPDPDGEKVENVFQFPEDLKLKTTTVLLNELKLVNDSGAPSFMRDGISGDLAEINYAGDELGYTKFKIMTRFFPFSGKNPDEIAILLSSEFVSKFTKVLYSNFGAIFKDIEIEEPGFWLLTSYSKQWTIVEAKTQEYLDELEPDPLQIDFGSETDPGIDKGKAAPGKDPGKGDGNPGDGEEDD